MVHNKPYLVHARQEYSVKSIFNISRLNFCPTVLADYEWLGSFEVLEVPTNVSFQVLNSDKF